LAATAGSPGSDAHVALIGSHHTPGGYGKRDPNPTKEHRMRTSIALGPVAAVCSLALIAGAAAANPPSPASTITVSVGKGSLRYNQKTFTAKAGLVEISFTNNSQAPHNVSLEHDGEFEYGATLTTKAGTVTTFLTLAKGAYHLYSSVGTDEDKGMAATLIVR
jgi:plastocyanin